MYTQTDDYYISLKHLAALAPVSNDGGDPVAARLHLADGGRPVRGFVHVCVCVRQSMRSKGSVGGILAQSDINGRDQSCAPCACVRF